MAKRGRKRMSLDDPRVERLLNALRLGDFVEEACAYAHITETTYYRWKREGEAVAQKHQLGEILDETEQHILEMYETIKEAEVSGQHAALETIRRAARDGTWQAAAWFLERRNKKWSNRTEVTGADGGPIETITVEDVDQKIRNLIAAVEDDRGGVETTS